LVKKVLSIASLFRNSTFLLTGVVVGILTSSCGEEYPEPMFTSSVIQGRINLGYSSEGPLEDFLVTAQGPYQDETTLTNSNGDFQLDGLGNGTYKLEVSNEGYGTKYAYGIQLFGSDTVWVWVDEVHQRVTGQIPELLTVETQNTSFYWLQENNIAITTNRTSGTVPARVFMADYKDVSYKHYQWTAIANSFLRSGYDKMMFHVEDIPFESGIKIYLILYICNPYESGYFDYYKGVWTYSTLEADEHSKVMDFIMP